MVELAKLRPLELSPIHVTNLTQVDSQGVANSRILGSLPFGYLLTYNMMYYCNYKHIYVSVKTELITANKLLKT